jgi:PAS domain S-box-containing protein
VSDSIQIKDGKGLSATIHFNNLVEWINEGVFCVNSDGLIVYANRQFCKNLRYSETEVIGKSIFDFFYDDKHAALSQAKLELRRKGVSDVYDIMMRRKTGEGFWVRVNGKPVYDAQGQFVGSVAIQTDISGQKQMEEDLIFAKEDLETKVITRTRQLSEVNHRLQQEIKDRKFAELSVKVNEKKFRDIFTNSPDAIYVESYEGVILDVNDAACKLHGLEKDKLIGRSVYEISPPELYNDIAQRQPLIINGKVKKFESECLDSSGNAIPIEVSAAHIEYRDKKALLMHVRDISDRRENQRLQQQLNEELEQKVKERTRELEEANALLQREIKYKEAAQSELQQQKDFLRLIIDSTPDLIYVKDAEGKFVVANKKVAEFYGLQPEEMEGHYDTEKQFTKDDIDYFIWQDKQVLETNEEIRFPETEIKDVKGGESLWLQTIKKPIVLHDGTKQILGVSSDITEIKLAKEKLFISEQLYREIARNLPKSAMFIFDKNLKFILAEGPLIGTVSKPKAEIEGKTVYETIRPSELDRVEAVYKKILQGENSETEQTFFGRSLKVYHIPIRDDDGDIVYGMVMILDISDLKETQRELEKRASELQRSNDELERFAYVASHDLQSPLRTIASYLQLLELRYKDKLEGEASEFIQYSVNGAKRMQTVIHELLNYSRISSVKKPFVRTDLDTLVKDVMKGLNSSVQTSGAEVHIDDLPVLTAEPNQLYQLFQNLIDNAMKFVKDRKPVINVTATEHEDTWEFTVSDNGIGIKEEFREKIFQMFQRLHSTTEYPGTGVGLAICKKIVELHGGQMWVESEFGEGTTFHFTISKHLEANTYTK